jgi:hypothetical protein
MRRAATTRAQDGSPRPQPRRRAPYPRSNSSAARPPRTASATSRRPKVASRLPYAGLHRGQRHAVPERRGVCVNGLGRPLHALASQRRDHRTEGLTLARRQALGGGEHVAVDRQGRTHEMSCFSGTSNI